MSEAIGATGTIDPEQARLRELLRGRAATQVLADGAMTRLTGGLSNQAWRVEQGGRIWYARLGYADAERLGVNRHSECALLAAVAAAGFAPDVLACDPRTGLLVTQYIDGRTWQASEAAEARNLARIGSLLARLHATPLAPGIAAVSYAEQARRFASTIPATDATAAALRHRADQAFERIERRKPRRALCHHDLHHLNVVDTGSRLWLVDWEYGGVGDPLFDVAGFLALHELGAAETDLLLDAYGAGTPSDREALQEARWAFDYVQWLWYRTCLGSRPDPGGVLANREARLASRLLRCNNRQVDSGKGSG
ncbi:MAG: thiamine kinase [Pseudomonadota bacterium]|nr:thiamine kinase [Pseudomonadota bacterium]